VLNAIVRPWASATFLIENQLYGPVDPAELDRISDGAVLSRLPRHLIDPEAQSILSAGGLASIPRLDPDTLKQKFGLMRALRIRRDLAAFRLAAMLATEPAAQWLVSA
jgi:hypothetical protein